MEAQRGRCLSRSSKPSFRTFAVRKVGSTPMGFRQEISDMRESITIVHFDRESSVGAPLCTREWRVLK